VGDDKLIDELARAAEDRSLEEHGAELAATVAELPKRVAGKEHEAKAKGEYPYPVALREAGRRRADHCCLRPRPCFSQASWSERQVTVGGWVRVTWGGRVGPGGRDRSKAAVVVYTWLALG
jgi:hypothetical protein